MVEALSFKCMRMFNNNFIIIFLFVSACSNLKLNGIKNELPATSLEPFGRTAINEQQELELISSAAHIGFSFEGDEANMYVNIPLTNGHNYLQYEMDGNQVCSRRILE